MAVLSVESLPLGFRFRPTDEELISHYLRLKINGRNSEVRVIPEIDVCKCEPWDLPGLSVIKTDDPEWFFFCARDRKYPNGHRSNRATEAGYWKATGKDRTIKSRKSASNTTLIGMKKTLVFYRGRAPRGERTNWIMHEYRATEKDLDGTGPGQAAFVLCRLFRKPEEKTGIVKCDEVEPTGYSPTPTKSSPDEISSSDVVQETGTSDIKVGEQSEVINRWLTNNSGNTTPSAVVPVDSCSNSHITSDAEDLAAEVTAAEAYPLMEENSHQYEPIFGELDCKLFSPEPLHIPSDLGYFIDSPYASDFGNDHNGFHFQDDISEQDVSLTELLDEVFKNNDEYSGEESNSQKALAVGSETQLCSHIQPGNFQVTENGTYINADTEMAQVQHGSEMVVPMWFNEQFVGNEPLQMHSSPGSCQAQASFLDRELGRGNTHDMGNNSVCQDASSANSKVGLSFGVLNSMEESSSQMNPVNHGSAVSGTGIKIRTRQRPVQPHSNNVVAQGTASRRIRLLMHPAESIENGEMRHASHGEEEEVQSTVTKVADVEQTSTIDDWPKENLLPDAERSKEFSDESTATVDDSPKENLLSNAERSWEISDESTSKLRLRVKGDGELGSSEIASSILKDAHPAHHDHNISRVYMASVFLGLILIVGFVGLWRYLRSYDVASHLGWH